MQESSGFRFLVNTLFDEYLQEAFDSLGPTLSVGFHFAKIGLGIFAIQHFASQDRGDVWKALKWFPLLFILFNYEVFAFAIFEFYDNLGKSFIGTEKNWDTINMKVAKAQIESFAQSTAEWNLFSVDLNALQSLAMAGLSGGITSIAHVVSSIIFVGIKSLSIIYLFILIIFGPINIGLSFIPALSGLFKAWLQKFMSVCLWVPMLYVVDAFMVELVDLLTTHLLQNNAKNIGIVLTASLLILMTSFFYIKAPTLANFVVQGLNISGGNMVSKPKHYGKKAINTVIDAKTGGASKGIRTLTQ